MRSKRVVALISLSSSAFLMLVLLWSDANASEFYKPEPPPDQKPSYTQQTDKQASGGSCCCEALKQLLPGNGSLNSAPTRVDESRTNWLDRPGNNLKLGAAILGGVSVASFIVGGVFMGLGRDAADNHTCGSTDISGIGCGFAGLGQGIIGISMLSAGAVTGAASLGLLIAGEVKAQKAAEEAKKRIEISPYINPIIEKNSPTASGAALEGAVAGIKGRF